MPPSEPRWEVQSCHFRVRRARLNEIPRGLSTSLWPFVLLPGQPGPGLVTGIRPDLYWDMNCRFVGLFFLASAVTLLAPDYGFGGSSRKSKPPASGEGKDKPKISLTADPAFGFTPVSVVLTGDLTGIDLHGRNFCHAAIMLLCIDPGP